MKLYIKKNISIDEKKFQPNSFFYQEKWINLIEKSFNYKRFYIVSNVKENKFTIPFLESIFFTKKYLISLPFSFDNNLQHKIEKYLITNSSYLKKITKKYNDIIIKSRFIDFQTNLNLKTKYYLYLLELNDNYKNKFSKNITRYSNSKNISFKIIKDFKTKEFNEFYKNYILNSKNLKTFFYPKFFLINMFNDMPDNFILINAYSENKYLGGQIILIDNKNSEAIYFISSKSLIGMKKSVDKILLCKVMEICYTKKIKIFNFGKANIKNKGLNEFKNKFGATRFELNYYSINQLNYNILDQNSFLKDLVKCIIKFLPTKIYIFFNNRIFKYLSMY